MWATHGQLSGSGWARCTTGVHLVGYQLVGDNLTGIVNFDHFSVGQRLSKSAKNQLDTLFSRSWPVGQLGNQTTSTAMLGSWAGGQLGSLHWFKWLDNRLIII